jgi:hypothetical protein
VTTHLENPSSAEYTRQMKLLMKLTLPLLTALLLAPLADLPPDFDKQLETMGYK